jgi:hypothetical protein
MANELSCHRLIKNFPDPLAALLLEAMILHRTPIMVYVTGRLITNLKRYNEYTSFA